MSVGKEGGEGALCPDCKRGSQQRKEKKKSAPAERKPVRGAQRCSARGASCPCHASLQSTCRRGRWDHGAPSRERVGDWAGKEEVSKKDRKTKHTSSLLGGEPAHGHRGNRTEDKSTTQHGGHVPRSTC